MWQDIEANGTMTSPAKVAVAERQGHEHDKDTVVHQVSQTPEDLKGNWRGRHTQLLWGIGLMVGDTVLLIGILLLLFLLAPAFGLDANMFRPDSTWRTSLLCAALAVALWSAAAKVTGAYTLKSASNRFISAFRTLFALIMVVFTWILLAAPLFVSSSVAFFKSVSLFLALALPSLSLWRVMFAELINMPRFRRRAVIAGMTSAGTTIARELSCAKRPYATLLGYIKGCEDTQEDMQQVEDGIPILGDRNALRRMGQASTIDTIISAIDHHSDPLLFQETISMSQLGISVIPMPIAYEHISGKIPVEHIGDQWYLSLPLEVMVSPLYLCWRKVVDVTFGLLGISVLLLILPVIALLIRLDSPGSIFYSQERSGRNGRPFRIYKFRSMRSDAEQIGQAQWAQAHDARVTQIGRFLRATHLDELPQMWNILRGEMSLIGPRPERAEFVAELEKAIPFYRYRLSVKPGLTGWAQVKYRYGNTENDALVKLQYDLYYIKHQSFMLDIFIILMTAVEMLFYRGI